MIEAVKQCPLIKLLRVVAGLVPVLVLFLAFHFLYSFFQQHSFASVWAGMQQIPKKQMTAAVVLTLMSYALLTGYDFLGLRYLGRKLHARQVLPTSFMAFGFNNNLGMAGLAGSSIRYHSYSRWGLTAGDVLKLIVVVSSSYWVGFLCVGGVTLTLHPLSLVGLVDIPQWATRGLGVLLLAQVATYLVFVGVRKKAIVIRGISFRVPALRFAGWQVLLSSLDWVLVAAVLYSLIPAQGGLGFVGFLAVFCLSQIVAVFTHVPGGIGVLEAMLFHFLGTPEVGGDASLMAALIVFRIIYYFIPLVLALLVLAVGEARRHFL